MPEYRRAFLPGGTFFFTLVTERRARILCTPLARPILRNALTLAQQRWPFEIRAIVLMPDHLHTLWTLPERDPDSRSDWRSSKRNSRRHGSQAAAPNRRSVPRAPGTAGVASGSAASGSTLSATSKTSPDIAITFITIRSSTGWQRARTRGCTRVSTVSCVSAYTTSLGIACATAERTNRRIFRIWTQPPWSRVRCESEKKIEQTPHGIPSSAI